jgi:ComF family protein
MNGIVSVAHYQEGPLREMVLQLKFGGQIHLAKIIAQLMVQRLEVTQFLRPDMILIPAPPAKKSWNRLTMNHTTEIAQVMASQLKLPLVTNLLKKIRSTRPQATLTNEQRRLNLKDAFACAPRIVKKYSGRPVLLIDDVITTCSTVSECARALRAAGMGEVRAVSLAR